jgi:hypothetical protein
MRRNVGPRCVPNVADFSCNKKRYRLSATAPSKRVVMDPVGEEIQYQSNPYPRVCEDLSGMICWAGDLALLPAFENIAFLKTSTSHSDFPFRLAFVFLHCECTAHINHRDAESSVLESLELHFRRTADTSPA